MDVSISEPFLGLRQCPPAAHELSMINAAKTIIALFIPIILNSTDFVTGVDNFVDK